MPVAVDSEMASNVGFGVAGSPPTSPQTFSFNNVAGSLLVALLGIGLPSGSPATFGTITYNGVTMTKLLEATTTGGANGGKVALFYLLNPATGSQTLSYGFTTSSVVEVWGGCTSFTGNDPVNPFVQSTSAQGTSAAAAATLSGVQSGNLTICGAGAGTAMSAQTQTLTWAKNVDNSSSAGNGRASRSASTGSVTHSFTVGASDSWVAAIAEIAAATAVAPPRAHLIYMRKNR